MEIGSVLERFLRPKPKTEIPQGLTGELERIYIKASDWVTNHLVKTEIQLAKQPFLLSQHEIKIVKTNLLKARAKKGKVRDHETEFLLENFFDSEYDKVFQELISGNKVPETSSEATAITNYLEFVKDVAPKFIRGESTFSELIKICNKIRGKRPLVLHPKVLLTNN